MRVFLKVLLGLLFLLILLGALTLLFFNNSVGKGWVSKEVKARTGIEMSYARFSPRSLNSFRVTRVEAYKEKNITLSQVDVGVNLLESLKRRSPVIKEIEVTRPQVKLEAEDLIAVLKNTLKKQKPPAPPKPVKRPPSGEKKPPSASQEKERPAPPKEPVKRPPPSSKPSLKTSGSKKKEPSSPRITVREGSMELTYKAFPGKKVLLSGISLKTSPEKKGEGLLSFKALDLPGLEIPLGLEIPIEVKGRRISLPSQKHTVNGAQLNLSGAFLGRAPYAFKFKGNAELPVLEGFTHPRVPQLSTSVKEGKLAFQAWGNLRSPQSIQCDLLGSTGEIKLNFTGRGVKSFNSQRIEVGVENGQLRIPSYELRSHDLNLMGNGIFTLSQKGIAVLRMISDKSWERQYFLLTNGLRLGRPAITMYELDTPDRYYKDFFIRLSPERGIEYQFQNQEKWYPLEILTTRLRDFTVTELAEE